MARILLIEDHALMREAFAALLRERGYEVAVADEGLEGLRLFSAMSPDLVILDRNLPGMTGSDILRRLRQKNPQQDVVIVSAHIDQKGVDKYRDLGARAFVSKTVETNTLLGLIQHCLNPAQTPPDAARRFDGKFVVLSDTEIW